MLIQRGPRPSDNFTIVANGALRDSRLSFRARGLLAYLLSHDEGWTVASDRLTAVGTEGREAVRTALKELEARGYLVRGRAKGAGNRWQHAALVTDDPISAQKPAADPKRSAPRKPATESRAITNKKKNIEEELQGQGENVVSLLTSTRRREAIETKTKGMFRAR